MISRGLCDINNSGTLNAEQFILAMYLLQQKVKGVEVPQTLTADMIPPSMRGSFTPSAVSSEDKVMTIKNLWTILVD